MYLTWLQKEEWTAADGTFKLHKSKLELAKEEAAAARSHTLSALLVQLYSIIVAILVHLTAALYGPVTCCAVPSSQPNLCKLHLQPALQGSRIPTGSARFELLVVCFHNAGMPRLIAAKVGGGYLLLQPSIQF